MTFLIDLPTELLQEIAFNCSLEDMKTLRVTNGTLCWAIEPLLFSRIELRIDFTICRSTRQMRQISLVDDLTVGRSHIGRFARHLRIFVTFGGEKKIMDYPLDLPKVSEVAKEFHVNAPAAFASLCNVSSVSLIFDTQFFRPMSPIIIKAIFIGLAVLQSVEDVSVCMPHSRIEELSSLRHMRGLRKLRWIGEGHASRTIEDALSCVMLASPDLSHLYLDGIRPIEYQPRRFDPTIDHFPRYRLERLFQRIPSGHSRPIRHLELQKWKIRSSKWLYPNLRNLDTLILHDKCLVINDFWDGLCSERIRIPSLTLRLGEDLAPLRYLASNTGMKRLTLYTSFPWIALAVVDEHANYFFKVILPRIRLTLEELHILPQAYGKWGFGDVSSQELRSCQQLSTLTICVLAARDGENEYMILLLDMVKRLRLHTLNVHQAKTSERDHVSPTVPNPTIQAALESYTITDATGDEALRRLKVVLVGGYTYQAQRDTGNQDIERWKFILQA